MGGPRTGGPTPSAATRAPGFLASRPSPTPARERAWVGRFAGHEVKVPHGHGATVSFTFDDGPSPRFTPQVLALLRQHHVPAVFCLIGTEARTYPSLVKQEVRAGHALCDHSRDHDIFMDRHGQTYVSAEVIDGLSAVRRAAPGVPVRFYRQPGGTWSPRVVKAMNQTGLTPLRWTDDPRDWSRPGSEVIVRRVVKKLHPGAVVLMHDGGGDRTQTVQALAWLLPALEQAGWKPVLAPRVALSPTAAAKPQ